MERKCWGGFKGVNRDVFDRGRQMLKRSCLFCVKTPPELAGSRAQMALCSKPNANEQIERDRKGRVGLWQGHRGGVRYFLRGGWHDGGVFRLARRQEC